MQSRLLEAFVVVAITVLNVAMIAALVAVKDSNHAAQLVIQIIAIATGASTGLFAYLRSLKTDAKLSVEGGIDPEIREVIVKIIEEQDNAKRVHSPGVVGSNQPGTGVPPSVRS